MGRVYILGAGASVFAQYPLGRELWRFIKENHCFPPVTSVSHQRFPEVESKVVELAKKYQPKKVNSPDLESLFTVLDLQDILAESQGWDGLRSPFIEATIRAFRNHQYKFDRFLYNMGDELSLDRRNVEGVSTAWVKRLSTSDTIITFNWDILHESLLYRAGKWLPYNGYGFTPVNVAGPEGKSIVILKLHGSVNWIHRASVGSVFLNPADISKFLPGTQVPLTNRPLPGEQPDDYGLIIPSFIKRLSQNKVLTQVWAKALDSLLSADQIIAVGYSLHSADEAARLLIATGFLTNKNSPQLTTIVRSGQACWDSFCSKLAVAAHAIPQTFEEWVTST